LEQLKLFNNEIIKINNEEVKLLLKVEIDNENLTNISNISNEDIKYETIMLMDYFNTLSTNDVDYLIYNEIKTNKLFSQNITKIEYEFDIDIIPQYLKLQKNKFYNKILKLEKINMNLKIDSDLINKSQTILG
jgi:hypothetical protein